MTSQAGFALRVRNPDVLTCIANLSNDEVFTPPDVANRMLDTIAEAWASTYPGDDIWSNPEVTFLDPVTKSGVFLREITARLTKGLEGQIPDLQERVDHILTKQVFGIGITRLTSLLARRSLYCSKSADGEHSIVHSFDDGDGNIWFDHVEHTWVKGRCRFCRAGQQEFDRGDQFDTHAYAFIHTDDIKARIAELFGGDMQFDVIIGNPPYQLSDGKGGGGTSAGPIYQHFVETAKALSPHYLSMIIPSRWFTGGKGLDDFRDSMLADERLRSIDDYLGASEVFPGIGLKGGVCYFLWDRDNPGPCTVTTRYKNWPISVATRPLLEKGADVFIRFNMGVSILKKVMAVETEGDSLELSESKRFDRLVSPRKPFGLSSTFQGNPTKSPGDLTLYQKGDLGYIARDQINNGIKLIDKWKLFVGFAAPGTGNKDTYPHKVISTPFVVGPGSVSTETYLAIGPFTSEAQAKSALSYLTCRLTRFLIQLHKASQNTTRKVYTFVPVQDWTKTWNDDRLYARYGLTEEEIEFLEEVVRPMDPAAVGVDDG
jgi:hypothetical protein